MAGHYLLINVEICYSLETHFAQYQSQTLLLDTNLDAAVDMNIAKSTDLKSLQHVQSSLLSCSAGGGCMARVRHETIFCIYTFEYCYYSYMLLRNANYSH